MGFRNTVPPMGIARPDGDSTKPPQVDREKNKSLVDVLDTVLIPAACALRPTGTSPYTLHRVLFG